MADLIRGQVNYLDTTVVIGMRDKGPVNIYLKGYPSDRT